METEKEKMRKTRDQRLRWFRTGARMMRLIAAKKLCLYCRQGKAPKKDEQFRFVHVMEEPKGLKAFCSASVIWDLPNPEPRDVLQSPAKMPTG